MWKLGIEMEKIMEQPEVEVEVEVEVGGPVGGRDVASSSGSGKGEKSVGIESSCTLHCDANDVMKQANLSCVYVMYPHNLLSPSIQVS